MQWVTFLLIFLPLAGALVVWLVPLPRNGAGGLALVVALGEVALWILALVRFDFGRSGLQFDQHRTWFSDLNVSYHVGFYGFSLWLAGLPSSCSPRQSRTRCGPAATARAPTSG